MNFQNLRLLWLFPSSTLFYQQNTIPTFIAVGADDNVTNVPAASYRTALDEEFSKLYMHLMNRALSCGLAIQTL